MATPTGGPPSLFKRRITADRPASEKSAVDLFRRSDGFYQNILAEIISKAPPQDASTPTKTDKKTSKTKRRKVSDEHDSKGKKHILPQSQSPTLIGDDDKAAVLSGDDSGSPISATRRNKGKGLAEKHSVNAGVRPAPTRIPPKRKSSPLEQEPESPVKDAAPGTKPEADDTAILLSDSDDEDDTEIKKPAEPRPRRDSWEEDIESYETARIKADTGKSRLDDVVQSGPDSDSLIDPEFEEYIVRARAQRAAALAAKKLEELNKQPEQPEQPERSTSQPISSASNGAGESPGVLSPGPQPTDEEASLATQKYRVIVTPRWPPTDVPQSSQIAFVRMNQELKVVKNAFLEHARKRGFALPDDVAASVILTWKGSKVYDRTTTGLTLGIRPDSRGFFRNAQSFSFTDGSGFVPRDKLSTGYVQGSLHLEIWTPELFAEFQDEQEKQRRRDRGELIEDDSDDEPNASQTKQDGTSGREDQGQKRSFRLVLASRNYDKLQMTVHMDTTVATLVQAFRARYSIGPDQKIAIHLDGEELEADSTVADADLEDMDSLEVHL